MINNPITPVQYFFEGTITFSSVVAGTVADQTITVPGLFQDALCMISLPNLQDGLTFSNPTAPALNTLKIRFRNDTGGDLTPLGTGAKLVQF